MDEEQRKPVVEEVPSQRLNRGGSRKDEKWDPSISFLTSVLH